MLFHQQVKKTFHARSWWDHHETWKDMRYDWLPSWQEIPKHLHQKTSREHLRGLTVSYSFVVADAAIFGMPTRGSGREETL